MDEEVREVLKAFFELSTSRSFYPGGAGPIPIEAILAWCQFVKYTTAQTYHFIDMIRAADDVFIEYSKRPDVTGKG